MNLDLPAVFGLLGMHFRRQSPTVDNCPLCGTPSKLEIRNASHVHCRACHFTGDVIELLNRRRCKDGEEEELEQTVDELEIRGILGFTDSERSSYIQNQKRQDWLRELVDNGVQPLKKVVPAFLSALLDQHNVRHPHRVIKSLTPHICVLYRRDLDGQVPRTARETMKWWGKYGALAITCYDGSRIVGFWLITRKGAQYLPMTDARTTVSGFAQLPSVTHDAVYVVDNPIQALRYIIWSVLEKGEPQGFVVPFGVQDSADSYRARRVVFWSPDGNSAWYLRALNTPRALTLDNDSLGTFDPDTQMPCRGSWGVFTRHATSALDAYKAAARHLLSLKEADARSLMASTPIDSGDKAKLKACVSGVDQKLFEGLLATITTEETVTLDGDVITATEQGWMSKGKLISSVTFQIDQIRTTGRYGEGTAYGTITYDGHTFPFEEDLQFMIKSPLDWLSETLIDRGLRPPYFQASWRKKLLEVSQRFHEPDIISNKSQYGWLDGALQMPHFVVDSSGVFPFQLITNGPQLGLPTELNSVEWDEFKKPSFCKLFLALLGNMFRTAKGFPGIGILLSNEQHVIERVAGAFGAAPVISPSLSQIDEALDKPLPLFTQWQPSKLRDMFNIPGLKHLMVSVDSQTYSVASLNPDWLRLRIGSPIDYAALRQVFRVLPRLLRVTDPLGIETDTFYREIVDYVSKDITEYVPQRDRLSQAAAELDTGNRYRKSNAATRVVELICHKVTSGEMLPAITEEEALVYIDDFLQATASPYIPTPSIDELTTMLKNARFLIRAQGDAWVFSREMWDMNRSLASIHS